MTTVVGVRCKEGIAIGSDSQGTAPGIKLAVKKVFKIKNRPVILGGAGDGQDSINFVKHLRDMKLTSEEKLKENLNKSLEDFLQPNISNKLLPEGAIDTSYYFRELNAILGARLTDGKNLLYHIYYQKNTHGIDVIDEPYFAIGTGNLFAHLLVKQQRRIFDFEKLDIDTIVGALLYIIDEAKDIDEKSNGNIQIGVISQKENRIIPSAEYAKYYDSMITNLSKFLDLENPNKDITKQNLKKIFPVSRKTFY